MKAVTLFSSGGIGDLAIKRHGIDILVANELLASRVGLHRHNFPTTDMIEGDVWEKKDEIIEKTLTLLNGGELDFLFATPPCQGMSKNGLGKLLHGIRGGLKSKFDKRNQLIVPALEIIKRLRPRTVFFENVPEMLNTLIQDETGEPVNIIDYIARELGDSYIGRPEIVQFADYGIPQRRSRLIVIYTRDEKLKEHFKLRNSFMPVRTHSKNPRLECLSWVTVRDVIENLPRLDGKNKESAISDIPFHRVSVLDPKKYVWISNTPPECGAFDNQCINDTCNFKGNATHGSIQDSNGINHAREDTPLYCQKCGALLPRPYTIVRSGEKRIMKGYTSAYKRMAWDLPSSTLTTNLSYPSSDHKLHPEQNRVLSLYEAFMLHTLDQFDYEWVAANDEPAKDTVITEVIGESIPPMGIYIILEYLLGVLKGDIVDQKSLQLSLIG